MIHSQLNDFYLFEACVLFNRSQLKSPLFLLNNIRHLLSLSRSDMWPLDKLLIHKNEHWRIFGSRSTDLPNISQSLNKVILDSARAKHLFFNFISQTHHHVLEGYLNIVYQVLVLWHGFMANALHRWEHSLEKWLEIVPCTTKKQHSKVCNLLLREKKSKLLVPFLLLLFFFFKVNIDFYHQHKSGQFYLWTIILKSVPQKKKKRFWWLGI